MLRGLIVFCSACFLFGCGKTSLPEKIQPKTITSPMNSPISAPSSSTPQQVIYNGSSPDDAFPVISSTPVIPSVVTSEEITMREQQVKIANNFEHLAKMQVKAGVGTTANIDRTTYFRLTNEIQLIQAKQLLQLKQQTDNSKAK